MRSEHAGHYGLRYRAHPDWVLHFPDTPRSEARNQLVAGLDFHRYYFALGARKTSVHTTICAPHVRLLGPDAAVVSYVRLVQHLDAAGVPQTSRSEETRVWQRTDGVWKHVHFHRSVS